MSNSWALTILALKEIIFETIEEDWVNIDVKPLYQLLSKQDKILDKMSI